MNCLRVSEHRLARQPLNLDSGSMGAAQSMGFRTDRAGNRIARKGRKMRNLNHCASFDPGISQSLGIIGGQAVPIHRGYQCGFAQGESVESHPASAPDSAAVRESG